MTAANVNLNAGTPKVARMIEGGLRDISAAHDKSGNMTKVPDLFFDKQVECISAGDFALAANATMIGSTAAVGHRDCPRAGRAIRSDLKPSRR